MIAEVKVPEVGESITEGTLTEWLKEDGAFVEMDEPDNHGGGHDQAGQARDQQGPPRRAHPRRRGSCVCRAC